MNRILAAFERMEKQIADRIASGLTTAERVAASSAGLDLDVSEYCRFQELKSLAVANGTITLDEGNTIYAALGNDPSTFSAQPVHVKYVLNGFFTELLKRSIGRAA